jgi:prevent-host-death family protein
MITVNMHQAKTQLSKLVELVEQGERVIIARNGTPVAELIAYAEQTGQRKGGIWEGKMWISPDFDDPLPEFEEYS